jgi:hypothetical protein
MRRRLSWLLTIVAIAPGCRGIRTWLADDAALFARLRALPDVTSLMSERAYAEELARAIVQRAYVDSQAPIAVALARLHPSPFRFVYQQSIPGYDSWICVDPRREEGGVPLTITMGANRFATLDRRVELSQDERSFARGLPDS